MGIRTRLKNRVRKMLGRTGPGAPSPTASASASAPTSPAPSKPPVAVAAPTARPSPAPAPAPAPAPEAAAPAKSAEAPEVEPKQSIEAEAEAKAARHFERTRRAVLKFIDEKGGVAKLSDMHDYSERKYFIGHRRFSDLMETLLEDALIDYDHGSGEASLTEAGRTLGNTKMPPRKRSGS